MSQPYVGQIMMFGGNFAPAGWMFCAGQLLPTFEYETLFQVIGTTYGGDGVETFALPNLQGRVPVHMGQGPGLSSYEIGQMSGTESVTLTTQQIPQHNHLVQINSNPATSSAPANNILATEAIGLGQASCYSYGPFATDAAQTALLAPATIGSAGGNQPHENRQALLALNFIISLFGTFPSQT